MVKKSKKNSRGFWGLVLGTPAGLLTTLAGIGLLVVTLKPGSLEAAVGNLVRELRPLSGMLLTLAIVLIGCRMIIGRK